MSNPYDQFDSLPLSAAEPNPYDQFDPPTAAAGNIYDQFDTAAPGTLPASRLFSPEQYQAFAGLGGLGPALAAGSLPIEVVQSRPFVTTENQTSSRLLPAPSKTPAPNPIPTPSPTASLGEATLPTPTPKPHPTPGHPFFEETEAGRKRQAATLELIYTQPGFFEEWKNQPENAKIFAAVESPDKEALVAVNQAFLAREAGLPPGKPTPAYEELRDRYAQYYFDKSAVNDEEFFDLASRLSKRRKAQNEAGAELYRETITQGLEDALADRNRGTAPVLQAWSQKHGDLINEKNDATYYEAVRRMLQETENELEPLRVPAARTWDTLTKFTQGKASDRDVLNLARDLGNLNREDRQRIFNYAAVAAQARGIDPAAFEQIAKNIGQSISRSFDFIEKGSLASDEDWARRWLNALENDYTYMADTRLRRAAGVSTSPVIGQWDETIGGSRPLTPEEKARFTQKFREIVPSYQVAREMKALAREQIDPIKPLAQEGTFFGTVERGGYGAAGSVGPMIATALHPGIGLFAYADEEYDRILVQNPDMDHGAARMISFAEGAANAAIDKVQLDKLPALGQLMKSVKSKGWRAAGGIGKTWTINSAQELTQNAVAPITETIAAQIRTDMATKDPGKEFVNYLSEVPETLAATAWLSLIGGGAISMRDVKLPMVNIDKDLRLAGFSKEQSARARSARSPEEFDAIVREEFPRRSRENIRAGELESMQDAQSDLPSADPPQGDRAARFLVELEKRKLLRRLAETNPGTASAKILNERLLEIDALIVKLETNNAQQKPANASPFALRFSRRESGESENGIHRLAKPQSSRYESPQDERNDPAAALHSLLRGDDPTASQQRGKPGRRLASHAELLAWSGEHGKILDPSRFPNVQAVGGGEHIVFPALDQPGRLYKLTKPGYFGAQAEDAGKYLQRWALANQVLDDEVHFEGMVTLPGETEARAVISQPEIRGRDATESEQADYLHSKGFVEEDGRWIHPVLGVSIWDTITPGNVIVRPDGSMQAVDLQIGPAKADDLNSVRERTGIGRPTVFSKEAIRPGDELLRRANELVTITEGISHYPTLRHAEALDWLRNPVNGVVGEHKNRDTGLSWNVSVTSLSKMVKQGIKAGEPAGAHAVRIAASYHLPELIENAMGFQVEDLRNDQNVSRLYDLFTPFRFNGTLYRIRIKGKASDHQANKAHSMRVDDIVAEKVPLEGIGNLASESPRITTATNGRITLRQLFKGVNPYSGSVFSLGEKLPPEKLTPEQGAKHSLQVQSWVGQVTAPWANRLPIVVHNSASAIPDPALRELVTSEENVDGFYNPADGSIHLLADKVTSREDAERIVRHEGMHLVFDGPLREEYLDLLDRVVKSIPEGRLREISERYKNQGPEVWLEEYLAQEGQNSPKSPVWRQFVYEIKRLLRRAFGDSVEFSDADIVAFLSKARRTMEKGAIRSTKGSLKTNEGKHAGIALDGALFNPWNPLNSTKQRELVEELKFAKSTGKTLGEIEKSLPTLSSAGKQIPYYAPANQVQQQAKSAFDAWPDSVNDFEGFPITIKHPRQGREETLFSHLVSDDIDGIPRFNSIRASWIPLVPQTIERATIKLDAGKSGGQKQWFYVGKYDNGYRHLVLVRDGDGVVGQGMMDQFLWTQFSQRIGKKNKYAEMEAYLLEAGLFKTLYPRQNLKSDPAIQARPSPLLAAKNELMNLREQKKRLFEKLIAAVPKSEIWIELKRDLQDLNTKITAAEAKIKSSEEKQ